MRRLIACLAVLVTAVPVLACGYGMPSPVARLASSDCVIVGRVMSLEERPLSLLPTASATQKVDYRIAVVRIDQGLRGAAGLTHVRIALLPHQVMQPGFEACFFLTQHAEEPVYLFGGIYDYPMQKTNDPAFAKEMDRYRQWGKLLDDPAAGLGSKDADERLLTAALLISQYRSWQRGVHRSDRKTEPIAAAESRRLLEVLADADWTKAGPDFRLSPLGLFALLGATAGDGWVPQSFKDQEAYHAAARTWLRDHAANFRIQAFVRS